MNKITLMLLLSFLAVAVRAADLDVSAIHVFLHGPVVENEKASDSSSDEPFRNLQVSVYLTNRGTHNLVIPTANAMAYDFENKKENALNIKFKYALQEDDLTGVKVIVSESSLGLVTLRPGETTVLHYRTSATERNDAAIKIEYAVSGEFAQRYETWSGTLAVISKPYIAVR
jgi:hypothetical protein